MIASERCPLPVARAYPGETKGDGPAAAAQLEQMHQAALAYVPREARAS